VPRVSMEFRLERHRHVETRHRVEHAPGPLDIGEDRLELRPTLYEARVERISAPLDVGLSLRHARGIDIDCTAPAAAADGYRPVNRSAVHGSPRSA
jgi:hypothetical protein